jgi:hypothetical protein
MTVIEAGWNSTLNVVDRDNANANDAGTVTFSPAIGSSGDVVSCPGQAL